MLETELEQADLRAEIQWVRSVIEDILTGRLSWDEEWLSEVANHLNSQA
jgi:hypothetical protein